MADWTALSVGQGVGALELVLALAPIALALLVAGLGRRPRDAAEFDGRRAALPAWSLGLSLATSDLALALACLSLPLAASQPEGGLVCLQGLWIGGVLGRLVVSRWLLPAAFAAREGGPTGWIAERLGAGSARTAESVFALAAWISAAARVLLLAFALHLALGPLLREMGPGPNLQILAMLLCCSGALLYAVRGLRGSVASDAVCFAVLLAAALGGLAGLVGTLDGGWGTFVEVFYGARRHELVSFDTSPAHPNTFWVALFVSSLGSVAHYGTDPLQLTRLLAAESLPRARRALWYSLVGLLPALVLCVLGGGVLAWRERNAFAPEVSELLGLRPDAVWPAIAASGLAPWTRGLVLAGFTALALVAAKSAVAALVLQSGAWRRRRGAGEPSLGRQSAQALWIGVGIALASAALLPMATRDAQVLDLALDASACASAALLAAAGLALLRRPRTTGFVWALPLALAGVLAVAEHGGRTQLVLGIFAVTYLGAWIGWRSLPDWFGHRRRVGAVLELAAVAGALVVVVWAGRWGFIPVERHFRYDPEWLWLPLSSPWYVPIGGWIGFVFGCLFARGSAGSEGHARSLAR